MRDEIGDVYEDDQFIDRIAAGPPLNDLSSDEGEDDSLFGVLSGWRRDVRDDEKW